MRDNGEADPEIPREPVRVDGSGVKGKHIPGLDPRKDIDEGQGWQKARPQKKDFSAKQIRRRWQQAADRAILPRGLPTEFTTVYFQPVNTKPILAAHPWERIGII